MRPVRASSSWKTPSILALKRGDASAIRSFISAAAMSASLCGDCGLLCRSQHEQSYTDDDKRSRAVKVSAHARIRQCLHAHCNCVSEARPCGEGDQAAIRRWAPDRDKQEDASVT